MTKLKRMPLWGFGLAIAAALFLSTLNDARAAALDNLYGKLPTTDEVGQTHKVNGLAIGHQSDFNFGKIDDTGADRLSSMQLRAVEHDFNIGDMALRHDRLDLPILKATAIGSFGLADYHLKTDLTTAKIGALYIEPGLDTAIMMTTATTRDGPDDGTGTFSKFAIDDHTAAAKPEAITAGKLHQTAG